jgi:hypothetical protein
MLFPLFQRGRSENTQIAGGEPPFQDIRRLVGAPLTILKPITLMVNALFLGREASPFWGHIMLLGEMVVARGIATVEQVMSALERQRVSGGHLGAHLIALGVLTSLELSSLLVEQNDARAALPFCERTLARWEGEFGVHHPATARARCNLAQMLLTDGQAEAALAEGRMAVAALRAAYGDDHAWTKKAEAIKNAAHHAVYGPEAAALARLRTLTKQSEPQSA